MTDAWDNLDGIIIIGPGVWIGCEAAVLRYPEETIAALLRLQTETLLFA